MNDGPLLFARYAYPPNALGYCGGDDPKALLEHGATGSSDGGLRELARSFEGAWPYLQLIAAANRIADPLDHRVVRAYWIGNHLLERVDPTTFAALLVDRFERRLSREREALLGPVFGGGLPHHGFHVLAVYPWVGLLRAGFSVEPLRVLDGCRIRWGTVRDVVGEHAFIETEPLVWDGRRLTLGPASVVEATISIDRLGFVEEPQPGQIVSLHWGWVCDRLTARDASRLERYTKRTLDAVNAAPASPPAAVLG